MWGNATFAPDDHFQSNYTHGELVAFRDQILRAALAEREQGLEQGLERKEDLLTNMTVESAGEWILARTPKHFQVRVLSL